jgi:hypothetical protein
MKDTTRRLMGAALWADEGSSRVRHVPVLDPDIVRALDVGQAAYIYRGGVTFVQVKRLVAAPAGLPPPSGGHQPGWQAASAAAGLPGTAGLPGVAPAGAALRPDAGPPGAAEPAGSAVLPDAGPLLDEAFGPESR